MKEQVEQIFKVGEKVIEDIYDREGVIKTVTLRDPEYVYRYKYLVEYTSKSLFGKEKKWEQWEISHTLRKIIN